MKTVFEDRDFLVVVKPYGVFAEESGQAESVISLLESERGGRFYPVNRLDAVTGGLTIVATSGKSAATLSLIVGDKKKCKKCYLCVVSGAPAEKSGRYEDLLFFDRTKKKTFICDSKRKGVKDAALSYKTLGYDAENDFSLLLVTLETGRTHQIRAQLSSRGMPIVFDGKYGSRIKKNGVGISLFSTLLEFEYCGRAVCLYEAPPMEFPFTLFENELDLFFEGCIHR